VFVSAEIGTMEIVNFGVRDAVIHRFEQSRDERQQAMVTLMYSCNPALETRHVDPRDISDLTRTLIQATPEELEQFNVDEVVGWLDRLLDIPMGNLSFQNPTHEMCEWGNITLWFSLCHLFLFSKQQRTVGVQQSLNSCGHVFGASLPTVL
jgi:hypothetical protein